MSLKSFISGFLALLSLSVWCQENCTVPRPPVLTLVSVQHETGRVNISWTSSPDSIAAYIVYTYSQDAAGWMPVDTIWDPATTTYTHITNATRYKSIRYVVAAYRRPLVAGKPGCPSELSNSISTIYLQATIDTCEAKITLRWNKYSDQPKKVTGYTILVSVNNSPLEEKYKTGAESDTYTATDFISDSQYCYAVKADLEDGTTSGSYKVCLNTNMQDPPDWIITDLVSVNENDDVDLSFSIDPSSEITKYILERGNGTFQQVAALSSNTGKVIYTDKTADVTRVNLYRLRAVNTCNIPVSTSDTSSNVVLTAGTENGEIVLKWNPLNNDRTSQGYKVFMNSGDGYEFYAEAGTANEYHIRLPDIIYNLKTGEACFYIQADPAATPHGITGESISSRACLSPGDGIVVPNLFTPDGDLRNDRFRPVLAFAPLSYHLVITDRQGRLLFETDDFMQEWDGSGCYQGVYLWFLKLKTPSGKVITRTGTITVVK